MAARSKPASYIVKTWKERDGQEEGGGERGGRKREREIGRKRKREMKRFGGWMEEGKKETKNAQNSLALLSSQEPALPELHGPCRTH